MQHDNTSSPVPFPQSYWVVPGKLLAGYYPGDLDTVKMEKKLKRLLGSGIRYIINLMEENERKQGDPFPSIENALMRYAKRVGINITCVRRPIKDFTAPAPEYIRNILDEIDDAVSQGKGVYVHCWGGKGRTGTVVGCYLARHGYAQGQDVLKLIEKLRHHDPEFHRASPETPEQRDRVTTWQEEQSIREEPMQGKAPESKTVGSLLESVMQLEKKNIQLETNNTKLEKQIILLQKQNAELERKILVLQKNSGKSSPPSDLADQLAETRERIGKKAKK
jgi:uncharacterized protein YggU (UPF0235/DUF167 family)